MASNNDVIDNDVMIGKGSQLLQYSPSSEFERSWHIVAKSLWPVYMSTRAGGLW